MSPLRPILIMNPIHFSFTSGWMIKPMQYTLKPDPTALPGHQYMRRQHHHDHGHSQPECL